MPKHISVLILFIACISQSIAQSPTIGLLFDSGSSEIGYHLFSPESNDKVYLINQCGQKVKEWTFSERPSLTAYLLTDGSVLRAGRDSIEHRSWNNELIWSYDLTTNGISQHHDIEILPNGNILCIARDSYPGANLIALGRDPSITSSIVRLDKIVELEPVG